MDKRNLNDEFKKALHIHNQGDLTQAGNIYKKILINAGTDYESLSFNLNYNTSKFQILHFCRHTRNVSKLKKKYFNKNVSSIYTKLCYILT